MFTALFGKRSQPIYTLTRPVDLDQLDQSFHLLKTTATEVSVEASKAAKAIEDRDNRIKACFEALNSASDIIFIINSDRNIFFCNDRFVEEFGLCDYKEAIDRSVCDIIPNVHCNDALWDEIRLNKTFERVIDGFRLTIVPMMNGSPVPIYYICTMKLDD